MVLLILVMLLTAVPAVSQFRELVTTDSGQELYLSSSLLLDDSASATRSESRVYKVTPVGVSLIAERGALATVGHGSSADGVGMPQVSGDGGTIGFTYHNVCTGDGPCTEVDDLGEVRGRYAGVLGPGRLQLSRNGRWALLAPSSSSGPAESTTLVDLQTGRHTLIPVRTLYGSSVASDGTVMGRQPMPSGGGVFGLWRRGEFTPILLDGAVQPLALSDDARVLVYLQLSQWFDEGGGIRLMVRELDSGADGILFESDHTAQQPELLGIDNTGRWVLFLVRDLSGSGAASVADTLMGTSAALPLPDGEFAVGGTLSGFGNRAYIATSAGRILKIELADGHPYDSETAVPATPYIAGLDHRLSPGSLVRLHGSFPGAVAELTGRLLLDGKPLPVLFASPGEVGIQVPWEQPTGSAFGFALDLPADSPFRQRELVDVGPFAPAFEPLGPGETGAIGVKLIKGDFSGLIEAEPRPGDIVHGYFTGLGAVDGSVETGVPVPVGAILRIRGDLHCRFYPHTTDLTTLFAGLAPGMVGVYQASFLVPKAISDQPISGMSCQLSTAYGGASFGVSRLVPQPLP